MLVGAAAALEQALAVPPTGGSQVLVERVACHLGQFEPDGAAGLALADGRAVDGVAVGCHIIGAQRYQIAAAQLAVDGEVEQGEVAGTPLRLQLRPDGPHVAGPQRRVGTGEFVLVARGSRASPGDDGGLLSFMVGLPS
jgi:hypothetical protein